MASERLIEDLVADLGPVRRRSVAGEALLLASLGLVELALYLALGFARPDLRAALALASFWWKLGSLGPLSVVGVATALRSFDPAGSPRRGLRVMALLIGGSLLIGWLIDGAAYANGGLAERLMWRHGIDCVVAMATLSIPAIIALGVLMRRGASTRPRDAALAAGIASAAWGAFVFVFNCPHDDPLYIAVWYLVGCSIVALIGRLALPRITRW